ncbi:MAG: DUF1648 domain-containing protein [Peptococcaceae bacterium]
MKFKNYHWLMILLTFLCMAFSVYYPLSNYAELPERIPTHFNGAGQPDSWAPKNMANLLTGQVIIVFTLFIMVPIVWWMAAVSDPRKIISGPRKKVEKMSPARAEQVRETVVFHLLFIMFLVALLIMTISRGTVLVALAEKTAIGGGVAFIIVLLVSDAVFLTWRVIKLVNKQDSCN